MTTLNEQDDDTRRDYNKYQLEVLQMEYEQAEALRQVQHTVPEQTDANASQVAAEDMMTSDEGGVNPTITSGVGYGEGIAPEDADEYAAEWDQEWDDLMAAEELERAQREQEEVRDDY